MTTLLTMKGFNKIVTPLCFTANTAGSTVALNETGSPTAVTLETSIDGINWSTYTFGTTITLSNIGDKVYWRNTSETTTQFSTNGANYYKFVMTGSIAASGDVNYLLCKNGTDTLTSDYCFYALFSDCTALTSVPKLSATTLTEGCYGYMFYNCTNLETLLELPVTTLKPYCYMGMFRSCSKIKISTTQTGEYQIPYRIPKTGTGTWVNGATGYMFMSTGGTYTSDPSINTTYYTSNTVI